MVMNQALIRTMPRERVEFFVMHRSSEFCHEIAVKIMYIMSPLNRSYCLLLETDIRGT